MILIMKLWHLSSNQLVAYSRHQLCFCETQHNDLALRMEQFWNLDDILRHDTLLQRRRYPLGQGLWLNHDHHTLCFQSSKVQFTFTFKSWTKYKNLVHWQIRSFLRHGRHGTGRQLHARVPTQRSHQFTRRPYYTSPRQTLPRASPNAGGQTVMRTQSPTVSQRMRANHGQRFSFKSTIDAMRDHASPQTTRSPHRHESIDIEEFSSVCSIEEDHSSTSS